VDSSPGAIASIGTPQPAAAGANLAFLVAAGILLSRIAGLIRESIFAHYLGNSGAADAFKAGFRIPNILQNLFGEGVLSASFIPVYSRLLSEGDAEAADLLAWSVGAILSLAIAVLVVAGVIFTPYLIDAIAPGFHGDHWICEIWREDEARWAMVDVDLPLDWSGDLDPFDIPADRFLVAGRAWQRCRAGQAAPDHGHLHGRSPFAAPASLRGVESRVLSPDTSNPRPSNRSGASRPAVTPLANRRGYAVGGCSNAGVNASDVRRVER